MFLILPELFVETVYYDVSVGRVIKLSTYCCLCVVPIIYETLVRIGCEWV